MLADLKCDNKLIRDYREMAIYAKLLFTFYDDVDYRTGLPGMLERNDSRWVRRLLGYNQTSADGTSLGNRYVACRSQ